MPSLQLNNVNAPFIDTQNIRNEDQGKRLLNHEDLNHIFLIHLGNMYKMARHLNNYLPAISPQVTFKPLKLAIMDMTIALQSHILRLDFVYKLLESQFNENANPEIDSLNLESYLKTSTLGDGQTEINFSVLTHLLMIENITLTSFAILSNLATAMSNKSIYRLVKQSLAEVANSKKNLVQLEQQYLAI